MSEESKNKKESLDKIVRAKIRGLGLDALFHQVDVSQKDTLPENFKQKQGVHEEINILERLKRGVSALEVKQISSKILGRIEKFFLLKMVYKTILDIGASSIKIAVFKHQPDRLKLLKAAHILIPHILGQSEEKLNAFIAATLANTLEPQILKYSFISTILPRNIVILKFIELPTENKQELKKMLGFEIDQHLPLAPSAFETDYQALEQKDKKSDVLLAAVKKEAVNQHLRLLKTCGISPDVVEISSTALYNAGLPTFSKEKTFLQLHIGAAVTDINVVKNSKLLFSRFLPWGGRNLTQTLSQNLNINFDDAEKIKKEAGIILTKAAANNTEKIISQSSCAWADNLVSQLKKTLEAFRLKTGIEQIDGFILSGGGSRLMNLNEYLRGALTLKAALLPARSDIEAFSALDICDKLQPEFYLCLGLIWPGGSTRHLEFNLLPEKMKYTLALKKQKIKQNILIGLYAFLFLSFILGPLGLLGYRNYRINKLAAQLDSFKPQLAAVRDLKDKIQTIRDYISPKNSCMEILREISLLIPDDITIDSFSFEKNSTVTLVGIAASHSSVVNFSENISKSPLFDNAKIIYSRRKGVADDVSVNFQIFCQLK